MREAEPMTQTMNVTKVRENWSKVVTAVFRRQQRIVLEKAGIPVAALVSADDLARLQRYDAERSERFTVLDRIGAAFADVPDEELEREVAKAVAAVRAELQTEREQAAKPA